MLANVLRNAPDQPLDDFFMRPRRRNTPDPANIPMALSTLVALSDFDKMQWMTFIHEHGFPITIRPRDASRDIIGKLLRYLEENEDARRKLTNSAQKTRSETSPELMRALQVLLKA
jgi:hypothetical protein